MNSIKKVLLSTFFIIFSFVAVLTVKHANSLQPQSQPEHQSQPQLQSKLLQQPQAPLASSSNQHNVVSQCPSIEDITTTKQRKSHVSWVVDGDTLHTKEGEKIRLLNINAPELNIGKKRAAESYAIEAKNKLNELLPKGSQFTWFYDVQYKDSYKRDLALIFNQQGEFVNQQLVQSGLAQVLIVPPNQRYWQCLVNAEMLAQKQHKRIWKQNSSFAISAKELNKQKGFQLVSGSISKIVNSKKYRWLVLDKRLWVGIKKKDFKFFSNQQLKFKEGQKINIRGYLYRSYGQVRMNLRHPAMLIEIDH